MTTLDDKLLGEKLQYYYSSSEGEDEDSEKEDKEGESSIPDSVGEVELSSDGSAVNTGIAISHWLLRKHFVCWKVCVVSCFVVVTKDLSSGMFESFLQLWGSWRPRYKSELSFNTVTKVAQLDRFVFLDKNRHKLKDVQMTSYLCSSLSLRRFAQCTGSLW